MPPVPVKCSICENQAASLDGQALQLCWRCVGNYALGHKPELRAWADKHNPNFRSEEAVKAADKQREQAERAGRMGAIKAAVTRTASAKAKRAGWGRGE